MSLDKGDIGRLEEIIARISSDDFVEGIPADVLDIIRIFSNKAALVPLPEVDVAEAYWLGAIFGWRLKEIHER